jgi:hypothetical protein
MKKYIIFVDGFGDYHAQCDTIEEANQYKEEILKGKEKQHHMVLFLFIM